MSLPTLLEQRLRLGAVSMEDWTDLTVTAWIRTTGQSTGTRIVSKDRVGSPGNFMLWRDLKGAWTMQAWDDVADKWQAASWNSDLPGDGKWHLIAGTVDSSRGRVSLFVDGQLRGEARWTARTLDDSDKPDLVIGADSDETEFGHAFNGLIHDVHLYPQAQSLDEHRRMFGRKDE